MTGVLLACAILLVFAGFITHLWVTKSFVLILATVVGLALQLAFTILLVDGYDRASVTIGVPEVAVKLVAELSQIMFLIVFALFSYIVGKASLAEMFPEEGLARKRRILAIGLIVVTAAVAVYAVVVQILMAVPIEYFVLDVSTLLLPATNLVYAGLLTGLLVFIARLVVREKQEHAQYGEMRRNAIIFACTSGVLVLVFLAQLVCNFVSFFRPNFDEGANHMLQHTYVEQEIISVVVTSLVAVAIFAYLAVPIVTRLRSKKDIAADSNGYVELADGEESREIPPNYEV